MLNSIAPVSMPARSLRLKDVCITQLKAQGLNLGSVSRFMKKKRKVVETTFPGVQSYGDEFSPDHTMDYEPFIKSQVTLWAIHLKKISCKFGRVTAKSRGPEIIEAHRAWSRHFHLVFLNTGPRQASESRIGSLSPPGDPKTLHPTSSTVNPKHQSVDSQPTLPKPKTVRDLERQSRNPGTHHTVSFEGFRDH